MKTKRIQWAIAFIPLILGAVLLYAQNPISIAQVGTTTVTTTVPVSGTVTANAGSGTMAVSGTFWQATQPVSGTVTANAGSGTLAVSNAGTFAVQAAQSGTWTVQPGNTANTTAWKVDGSAVTQPISGTVTANAGSGTLAVSVASVPSHPVTNAGTFAVQISGEDTPVATATTTNAATTYFLTSAASTNSTSVKGSAGNLYAIHITNTTTTNYFLRLYNASSAPTCSSATGFIESIPALGASANGGVNGRTNGVPQAFSTGIAFCLTGGGASTDNTNAATGVYLTLVYK